MHPSTHHQPRHKPPANIPSPAVPEFQKMPRPPSQRSSASFQAPPPPLHCHLQTYCVIESALVFVIYFFLLCLHVPLTLQTQHVPGRTHRSSQLLFCTLPFLSWSTAPGSHKVSQVRAGNTIQGLTVLGPLLLQEHSWPHRRLWEWCIPVISVLKEIPDNLIENNFP